METSLPPANAFSKGEQLLLLTCVSSCPAQGLAVYRCSVTVCSENVCSLCLSCPCPSSPPANSYSSFKTQLRVFSPELFAGSPSSSVFSQSFAHALTLPLLTLGQALFLLPQSCSGTGRWPSASRAAGALDVVSESVVPFRLVIRIVRIVFCSPCVIRFPQSFGHPLEGRLSVIALLCIPALRADTGLWTHKSFLRPCCVYFRLWGSGQFESTVTSFSSF